jgi:hypothetical protein
VFAIAICLHYGRLGILPLDNAIVFDGGWRLSGQRPFVDFTTPVAITPIVMQAALFRVLGVSWFTYRLHAALLNALFALLALAVMRAVGAGFFSAWVIGVGSTVAFYPPVGVPYMDQHSFFFSLCCVLTAVLVATGSRFAGVATFWTPTLAALALFSKQIPALFIALPAAFLVAVVSWRGRKAMFAAGLALPVLVVSIYMLSVHAPLRETIYYLLCRTNRHDRSFRLATASPAKSAAHGLRVARVAARM